MKHSMTIYLNENHAIYAENDTESYKSLIDLIYDNWDTLGNGGIYRWTDCTNNISYLIPIRHIIYTEVHDEAD